jgi:hypothetical protein
MSNDDATYFSVVGSNDEFERPDGGSSTRISVDVRVQHWHPPPLQLRIVDDVFARHPRAEEGSFRAR